jgi:hypothetical protein
MGSRTRIAATVVAAILLGGCVSTSHERAGRTLTAAVQGPTTSLLRTALPAPVTTSTAAPTEAVLPASAPQRAAAAPPGTPVTAAAEPTTQAPDPALPARPSPPSTAAEPVRSPAESARDKVAFRLAATYGFSVRFGTSKANYALTSASTCVVTLTPNATIDLVRDVLLHEYIHVLQCRAGAYFTVAAEHVADAGAAYLGAKRAFYGPFTSDDTLIARRLIARIG